MSTPARLFVLCGLPGAGKTTTAREIARTRSAVRMCSDDWMMAMGMDLWDQALRYRIEATQWGLAGELLSLGVNVVIEFGSWARAERDVLREGARAVGADVELLYLDVPIDELVRRLEHRNAQPGEVEITRAHLEEWAEVFETPRPDELALFDTPLP